MLNTQFRRVAGGRAASQGCPAHVPRPALTGIPVISHSASPMLVAGSRSGRASLGGGRAMPVRLGRSTGGVKVQAFFSKLFKNDPSASTRNKYQQRVDAVNAFEPKMRLMTDEQLRAKTQEFKERVAKGESLDSLLPEAFAVGTGSHVHWGEGGQSLPHASSVGAWCGGTRMRLRAA